MELSQLAETKNLDAATNQLKSLTGSSNLLLTSACTHALEMTALLLDLQPGDEVIMPSFTFVTTATAFVLRGAVPVFVDIRPDTLNIDESLVESAITPQTKAIVAVHYAAVACQMDVLRQIADQHGLALIEDAAQCIDSYYQDQHLGTLGDFGTLSFHHTKNITSGFGGALLINNKQYVEHAKVIWQKGTNREAFLEGQVDKYTWMDVGSAYQMCELNAELLVDELKQLEGKQTHRLNRWQTYFKAFESFSDRVQLPTIPDGCQHNGHIFYLVLATPDQRTELLSQLNKAGIPAAFHYQPLHDSPAGKRFGKSHGELPETLRVASCLLRLPVEDSITQTQIDKAIELVSDHLSAL